MENLFARKLAWAVQKPYTWASLLLAALTFTVIWVWPGPIVNSTPSDTRLRLWALGLQLLGAWIVWHDLTSAGRSFGQPGLFQSHWQWIKDCLGLSKPQHFNLQAGGLHIHATLGAFSGNIVAGVDTVEGRLQLLEHATKRHGEEAQRDRERVATLEHEMGERLAKESQARSSAVESIQKQLRDVAVGNHGALLFGAGWVAVGTVLSAVAPEIARLVAGQWQTVLQAL